MVNKKDKRVTILPETTDLPTRIYSNFAIVSSSPMDVTINFMDYTQPFGHEVEDSDDEEMFRPTPVVARIAIRPEMVQGLINALKAQLEEFEKKHQLGQVEVEDNKPKGE